MFESCQSLIFLNLYSFNFISPKNKAYAFNNVPSTVKYCINDYSTKTYILGDDKTSDCSDICFKDNIIINITNNKCIEACSIDYYKFKFNNKCYTECPKDTYPLYCEEEECKNNKRECYNYTIQGYYLDTYDKVYQKCFKSCKVCNGQGNEINNKCIECNSNFTFLNNTKYSSNCYEKCDYYYYFDESNIYHCCEVCPKNYSKLIRDKNKCIDKCENDDIYKYEYNNFCYSYCPNNTIVNKNSYICQVKKNHQDIVLYSTIISNSKNKLETEIIHNSRMNIINSNLNNSIDTYINVDNDNYDDNIIYLNVKDIIISNNINNITNVSTLEIEDKVLEKIQEIFINGFNSSNVDEGNDINFSYSKVIYTITTTSNQKNNENKNISTINFGECEDKLKENYNISYNDSLYIFKVDTFIDNIHKIEYEVYYPFSSINLTRLNLTICKNIKIIISIPLHISSKDIDKYNISSGLYNDICIYFNK